MSVTTTTTTVVVPERTPGQKVALEELGDHEDREGLPFLKCPARGDHVGNRADDPDGVVGVDPAHQFP